MSTRCRNYKWDQDRLKDPGVDENDNKDDDIDDDDDLSSLGKAYLERHDPTHKNIELILFSQLPKNAP